MVKVILLVLPLLSGCAQLAMNAAERGDLSNLERNLEYVDDSAEKERILAVYDETMCGKAAMDDSLDALFLLGLCYGNCKTPKYCKQEQGAMLIVRAAQAGHQGAASYIIRAGGEPPQIDPQLAALYEAKAERKLRHAEALSTAAALSTLNKRTCTWTSHGDKLVQECN